MVFKSARQKVLYFFIAVALALMLVGAFSSVPSTYAGDCPGLSGQC